MARSLPKKSWSDLNTGQQACVIAASALQVGLLAAALWDLAHRSAEEVRGSRKMWAGLCFIDFFGPIAYFTIGRKGCCMSDEPVETEMAGDAVI
jgi:hypothetical protein